MTYGECCNSTEEILNPLQNPAVNKEVYRPLISVILDVTMVMNEIKKGVIRRVL